MTTTTAAEAQRAVQAGAALLDEKGPAGWRSKIKPNSLDMFTNCTLDQAMGNWTRALRELGIEGRGTQYGFTPGPGNNAAELRDAWIAEAARGGKP